MAALSDGRYLLLKRAPYLASLLMGVRFVATPRIPTMGVSPRMVLAYNPDYVQQLTPQELCGALWHEMMHLIHTVVFAEKLPSVNKHTLNIAADLHINSVGRFEGLTLPKDVLYPEQYGFQKRLSTLQYLALLEQKEKEKPPPSPPQQPLDDKGEAGQGSGEEPAHTPGCGSGACGLEGDLKAELEAAHGRIEAALGKAVQEVARAVREAARGTVPGELKELLEEYTAPSLTDWRTYLRAGLLTVLSSEGMIERRTYAKPHKKAFVRLQPVVRAGRLHETPEVTIIVDTSGSMDSGLLKACMSEIMWLLESMAMTEVELIQADTRICHRQVIELHELTKPIEVHGRGGTSFSEPLQQLAHEGGHGLVVYLTDGYGDFEYVPPFPVVWAVFTDVVPPWGIHVPIYLEE